MIRPAKPSGTPFCAAMVNDWIDGTVWHPRVHPPEDVERYNGEVVWTEQEVLVAGNPPKAFIALDSEDYLTALYANQLRRGIGRALMEAARSPRDALHPWTHVPNTAAQAFYPHMGFKEVRRTDGDNEERVPDILYRWSRP